MVRPFFKTARRADGFTLVELLIVVAIIGVLSTVAVPTFRRMIAKSKKTEAKVNLGGLYTAEQAFLAEYGAYANNLDKTGFQSDGNGATDIYTIGFVQNDCSDVAAILPGAGSPIGLAITQVFPAYYPVAPAVLSSKVGNAANNTCAGTAGSDGIPAGVSVNVYDAVAGSNASDRFLASATGPIWPGITPTSLIADKDVWTIDNNRALRNGQDGVK